VSWVRGVERPLTLDELMDKSDELDEAKAKRCRTGMG